MPRSGWFITFEGGEGAGKSTQIAALRRRLEAGGSQVLATREPGGSQRAEAIRDFLLSGGGRPFGPLAEAMLFAAARADHVAATIRPALVQGTVVLCDRFSDSTRVYQGALGAVPTETIALLDEIAVGTLRPDLTLILDVPAELGLERAAARRAKLGQVPDRFELQDLAYHHGIRRAFLALAEAEPLRCTVIDASRAEDVVADAIRAVVSDCLGLALTRAAHGE